MNALALAIALMIACGDDDANPHDTGRLDAAAADSSLEDAFVDDDGASEDVGSTPDAGPRFPPTLRATGLYDDAGALAADVLEFGVRYPLWSDGLRKTRWLRLPEGGTIDVSDPDQWRFPVGTQLWKEFAREDGTRLETRLFEKRETGWTGISYVWRADGADADPLPDGTDDLDGSGYEVPSMARCTVCHNASRDRVLGVSRFLLREDDRAAMEARGWLTGDVLADPPGDTIAQQALGVLHSNCGSCHSDDAPPGMVRSLRFRLRAADARVEDVALLATALGQEAAHDIGGTRTLLVAGDPEASQVYVRMGLRGDEGMPPFGTDVVDAEGHAALRAFIEAL